MNGYQRPQCQIVGFGFGASLVALFAAQLGGGHLQAGADVGGRLVGNGGRRSPRGRPRNPAVISLRPRGYNSATVPAAAPTSSKSTPPERRRA